MVTSDVLPASGYRARQARSALEHFALVDACREGNIERAVKLLDEHITQTQKSLMAAGRRRPTTRDKMG